ncbi:MAG: hypothetical protein OTJ44_02710 [Planctomycetota bacterium]|nr:hypothetical protein [Planctomycetota bacterium]
MGNNVIRIRKRDGFEESFDALRLSESLQSASGDVLPEGGWLGRLVHQVRQHFSSRVSAVETAEISVLCVRLLRASGLEEASLAYQDFRFAMDTAVSQLRVHTGKGAHAKSGPWDRSRLALSLVRERYLENTVARQVAHSVERRFSMAGQVHLTGRFVAAAVDNECRTLGLAPSSLYAEEVGIDRGQLRAWLGGDCMPASANPCASSAPWMGAPGQDPRQPLGEEVLARFALEEVLSKVQADAMTAGHFALPALGDWLRPARNRLRPSPGESETDFWKRVRREKSSAREIQVFWPRVFPWTQLTVDAPPWLDGVTHRVRLGTSCSKLALQWIRAGHWVSLPLAAFAQAADVHQKDLAESGKCTLSWQPPHRLPPPADRAMQTLDGFAVVNVGGLAQSLTTPSLSGWIQSVQTASDLAAQSVAALCARGQGCGYPRATLFPVGLSSALQRLFPGDELRSDRVRRQLLSLRHIMEQSLRQAQLRSTPASPPHPGPVGIRLAELEGRPPHQAYSWGWSLPKDSGLPSVTSFDTSPWLEFPAAVAHADSSWIKHQTPSCT